jgi:hypothetical protein
VLDKLAIWIGVKKVDIPDDKKISKDSTDNTPKIDIDITPVSESMFDSMILYLAHQQ